MVEHFAYNEKVSGSNPLLLNLFIRFRKMAEWFKALVC